MREPLISELEKLINHFRETDRENELREALFEHGIGPKKIEAIDPLTHEINPEAVELEKIAVREGLIPRTKKLFKTIRVNFKEKWYFRYTVYYIALFLIIFSIMNAPIIYSQFTYKPNTSAGDLISYQTVIEPNNQKSAKIEEGEIVPKTPTLLIPKINIRAAIIYSNTTNEATLQGYLQKGVVHYPGTATPGKPGNSFIAGHSSNAWWVKGKYNFIFTYLDKLKVGDNAIIYDSGNKYVYELSSVKVVSPNDVSVLAQGDTPELTLMTCTPLGTNWKRLIVRFKQVAPEYNKPILVTKTRFVPPRNLMSTDDGTIGGFVYNFWKWLKSLFGFSS
jgi:sortase A